MSGRDEFGYSFIDLFDGQKDTLEELEKLLKAKVLSVTWGEVSWFSSSEEDEGGMADEVRDAIDWMIACGIKRNHDVGADWLICPYSNWQGRPFKILLSGGVSDGDPCSDAQEMMLKLYESILPLTTSEEVVLAYRVRRRRGVPCRQRP